MRKFFFIFTFGLLISYAQTNPNWEYWTSNRLEVKRGMSAEFEKAASVKTKKFNTTPETAISTYKVMTGPDQGKYERIQGYKDISWCNYFISNPKFMD